LLDLHTNPILVHPLLCNLVFKKPAYIILRNIRHVMGIQVLYLTGIK